MTKNEGKRLQEEKNALLQEMLLSLEKQKEAFRQGKMDLFANYWRTDRRWSKWTKHNMARGEIKAKNGTKIAGTLSHPGLI